MRLAGVWMVSAVFALSCTRPSAPASDAGTARASGAIASELEDEQEPERHLYPSRRCGECHGRQRQEWLDSAHSQSARGSFQHVLGQLSSTEQARCAGCHLPLAEGGERLAADGVGCDACHTAVASAPPPQMLKLAPEQATRFGPYRDAKSHSFHRVAYSAFVTEAGLCEACHQDPPSARVPEYTTVEEWGALPDRAGCVDCHMPTFRAVAAKGEQVRSVSHHDFHPDKAAALREALELEVQLSGDEATVALTNTGAHHDLPTGRPERRLRLELEWRDGSGQALHADAHLFGRELVGADGAPAPSFLAVRQSRDERLVAKSRWSRSFRRVTGARQLSVRLYYDAFDRGLGGFFGPSEPILVMERKEAL